MVLTNGFVKTPSVSEESDDDILIDEATSSSSTEAVSDGHIWREKFGVTPIPMSGITRKVAELKRRFEHAFKGFNRDIWTHFVVNLQVSSTDRALVPNRCYRTKRRLRSRCASDRNSMPSYNAYVAVLCF